MTGKPTHDDLTRLSIAPDRWTLDLLSRSPPEATDEVAIRTFYFVAGCLRRYRAAIHLLTDGFIEDATLVGLQLQEDVARLRVLAEAPEALRAKILWAYRSESLEWRRKMIDDLARSTHAEALKPVIDARRAEQVEKERQLLDLQIQLGGVVEISIVRGRKLVERLGGVTELVAWSSAAMSDYSSWSPQQARYLEQDESGVDKIWMRGPESLRVFQSLGRWLFAAADAYEIIHKMEPPGDTRAEFNRWNADLSTTFGV